MDLRIRQFRRIESLEAEFTKPVNLLVGMNQSGKSSILGAIQVALTGTHPDWLRRRGDSLYDLRRWGAKKAEIVLDVDGLVVGRTITKSAQTLDILGPGDVDAGDGTFAASEWLGSMTEKQAGLHAVLGLTGDHLTATLSAGQFVGLGAKGQVEFLSALAGAELTAPDIYAAMGEDGAEIHAETLVAILGERADLEGAALLDACEEVTRESRKAAKKNRDAAEREVEELRRTKPPKPDEGTEVTAEDERRLDELRESLSAAHRHAGQMEEADKAIERAETAVQQAKADVEAASRPDAGVTPEQIAELTTALGVATDGALDAEQAAMTAMGTTKATAQTLETAKAQKADLEAALEEAGAECSLCHQRIDGEVLEGMLRRAGAERDALTERLATETAVRDSAAVDLGRANHKRGQAHEALAAVLKVVEDAEKARTTAQTGLGRAECTLKDAKHARAALPEPGDPEVIEAQIKGVEEWDDYNEAVAVVAAAEEHLAHLEDLVEQWEWLVDKFGSGEGSYRATLMGDGLAPFEAAVNRVLEPILHQAIVLPTGDQGLALRNGDVTVPATPQYLSGSELLRLQVALQFAFARVLDFPLVLLDCEAALDYATRASILTLCRELAAEWPELRMFVTMVPTRQDWVPVTEDWCATWAVEDGNATEIRALDLAAAH